MFWVYLVGVGFLCGALAMATRVQARLAAALVGLTMFIFVLTMDAPAVAAHPNNRFFWALALRQLAFSGGRSPSRCPHGPRFRDTSSAFLRCFTGSSTCCTRRTCRAFRCSASRPGGFTAGCSSTILSGVVLIVAGVCLVANIRPRIAATSLGLSILLAVCWVYLPMLLAAPKDVVALNFFLDTLMFSGAVLLLANATD